MTAHTAESLAALSGVELARIVAVEVMGWTYEPEDNMWWSPQDGTYHFIGDTSWAWRPFEDHNHAAEVRAECLRRWQPTDEYVIWNTHESHKRVSVAFRRSLGADIARMDGERSWLDICRCTCIVAVLACQALGGGK